MSLRAARRDDADDLDIFLTDRMGHNDDRQPERRPRRPPAEFAIGDPVELEDQKRIVEDERSGGEVDAVLATVGAVLRRIPLEPRVRTFLLRRAVGLSK
jgi:hypothetical protein